MGSTPRSVQERLGHASIGITLDTYSHVAPGLQAAAALRFDEGLGGAVAQSKKGLIQQVANEAEWR